MWWCARSEHEQNSRTPALAIYMNGLLHKRDPISLKDSQSSHYQYHDIQISKQNFDILQFHNYVGTRNSAHNCMALYQQLRVLIGGIIIFINDSSLIQTSLLNNLERVPIGAFGDLQFARISWSCATHFSTTYQKFLLRSFRKLVLGRKKVLLMRIKLSVPA